MMASSNEQPEAQEPQKRHLPAPHPTLISVADLWQDYRLQPASWINSLLIHIVALAALVVPFVFSPKLGPVKASNPYVHIYLPPSLAALSGPDQQTSGGGGGGDRSPAPASRGRIPEFSMVPLAPPTVQFANTEPRLPVQPKLLGPDELRLPEMTVTGPFGDPQSVAGPLSGGPGGPNGIGDGSGPGIGSSRGPGYGPGENGGCCGPGPFSVGGAVTAPVPVYQPEPPYTEEARKAKFSGTVLLTIVVDAQGYTRDVRLVKPLGMGLDEKALETVRTWRFRPGRRNNVPVPVSMLVEITFRLF